MRINGKITEIITSRALVSFGGFVELEGKEFEDMKNIFTYLSKEYEFYCNHVVLKCKGLYYYTSFLNATTSLVSNNRDKSGREHI